MIRFFTWLVFSCFLPFKLFAQSSSNNSFSFAPPITDSSVVFLEDIFGVVDGVLNGTGSQIMASIFAVFNAAVLALGGIIIMYTLIVGTMNTAQEGQMLGQKWSSIWVPLRATFGLALLLPKSSGYCLIQIFVMWAVVQGIGAADKVWNAALDYLNRGGVIVQAQMSTSASTSADSSAIANGAAVILAGQVCMLGLQQQLESQRLLFNSTKNINTNICSGTPAANIAAFCSQSVPDFISTVNFLEAQNAQKPSSPSSTTITQYKAYMPSFGSESPFYSLNGICGYVTWNSINSLLSSQQQSAFANQTANNTTLTAAQNAVITSVETSRPIALQQMYANLALAAQNMVGNDPQLSTLSNGNTTQNAFSTVALDEYGVPYTSTGTQCTSSSDNCTNWSTDKTTSPETAVLFNGTEFVGAIADYNGVMMPTVNLVSEMNNESQAQSSRDFISAAESSGWMMAGSYFFNLVQLNGNAVTGANQTDTNTGLNYSTFSIPNLTTPFSNGSTCGNYCNFLNNSVNLVNPVISLLNGMNIPGASNPAGIPFPTISSTTSTSVITGVTGSTAFGFINNGAMVQLPGQPGLVAPSMLITMNITTPTTLFGFQPINFPCGTVGILICLGRTLGDIFYNTIILNILNFWVQMVSGFFNQVIETLLYIPLQMFVTIFQNGANIISNTGVNPIVSLAQMGTAYINTAMELWIQFMSLSIIIGIVPGLLFLVGLIMPLVFSWMGTMVGIGFLTAYYIPFVPYMIFTFGVIAWLLAVIEAMVAAPIVALGITHPEGEGILGKGEQGLMILLNVFLRPALMIIGFIAGISMCYVSVWVINTGFQNVTTFMNGGTSASNGYTGWASLYAGFFVIVLYTMLYLTVVQKAFTLVYTLPDKVLRWIGGQAEQYGQETAQWSEESKSQIKEGGQETGKAGAAMTGKMSGQAMAAYSKGASQLKKSFSPPPSIEAEGSSGEEDKS